MVPFATTATGARGPVAVLVHMTGADLKLAPNASIQTEMHYFSRKNVKVLAVFLEA